MKETALAIPKESSQAFLSALRIFVRSIYKATGPVREQRSYVQKALDNGDIETFYHYKQILPWYLTVGLQPNRLLI